MQQVSKNILLTVILPRFLIEHAMLDVFPLMPMTALLRPSTKYGPDSEPVGSGVALSYSCPMSLPDRQEVWPAKLFVKTAKIFATKIIDGFFAKSNAPNYYYGISRQILTFR